MIQYRIYALNPAGRIQTAEWLEASDDDAAIRDARRRCGPAVPAVEVWRGADKLAVIDCADPMNDSPQ